MSERKQHNDFERGLVIGAHLFGGSKADIARKFTIPESTVRRFICQYEVGNTQPEKRPGRPRMTTPQTDGHLQNHH